MEKKKEVSLVVVILNIICAVLWSIHLFVDIFYGQAGTFAFVMHVFCAVVWDFCAVVWIVRYVKSKRKDS